MAKDYKIQTVTISLTPQEALLVKAIGCLEERQHRRRLGLRIKYNSLIDDNNNYLDLDYKIVTDSNYIRDRINYGAV